MRAIEIIALENGAHRNQNSSMPFDIPEGWAVIHDDLAIPDTFPFVNIEVAEIEGVMTVTSITAGVMPDPEPVPDPEPTELEQLRADVDYIAMETGVDLW